MYSRRNHWFGLSLTLVCLLGVATLVAALEQPAATFPVAPPHQDDPIVTSTPTATALDDPQATSTTPATSTPTATALIIYLPFVGRPQNTATPAGTPVATPADPAAEILIPAGSFQMGCDITNSAENGCPNNATELPLHTVYLDAYYIDKYEVTNTRYQACVKAGRCTPPPEVNSFLRPSYYDNLQYGDYPVIFVTWYQASVFCGWAGERLPSEAEWEKAARGTTDTRKYPWGNEAPDCSKTNFASGEDFCVRDTDHVGAHPAGKSPFGVMDMAGNVWEWVNDWYVDGYYQVSPASNPQGPTASWSHVLRGGSWMSGDSPLRSALRGGGGAPNFRYIDLGFRCARTP